MHAIAIFAVNDVRFDFLLLMDVNEYGCSEGTYTQIIHNLSTRSHASEEEIRTRNRSKNTSVDGTL
jgi:hypothetical protein